MNDRMVWIDCEMTGLSLAEDALIEVAALVTDSELNVLGEGVDIVIRPPDAALETMPEVVRQMHTSSGLLDELAGGSTLADAEEQVLAYVREHVKEPGKAPLCGNSVSTDRGFLFRDMPALEGYLHYRIVDVSSIKELARRWYPRAYFNSPDKNGNHRALADIRESIAELRYYREAVFVPSRAPTPTRPSGSPPSTCWAPARTAVRPALMRVRAPSRTLYTFSRPVGRKTGHGGYSSAGRAPGCGPGCRGFESRYSPLVDQRADLRLWVGPLSYPHGRVRILAGPMVPALRNGPRGRSRGSAGRTTARRRSARGDPSGDPGFDRSGPWRRSGDSAVR